MCNRVRGSSKQVLRGKFGDIIISEGVKEVPLDALPERPDVSFVYEKPKLLVVTSVNPQRWEYMCMKYLPREANGNFALQEKLGDLYQARADTIFEKFSFKGGIIHRRCIIPLEGFTTSKAGVKSAMAQKITNATIST